MILLAAVVAGLYLLAALALFTVQRSLLYPAAHALPGDPRHRAGCVYEPDTGAFYLYRAAPEGAPTVVYFHGNGEVIEHSTNLADTVRRHGMGFVGVEYPGYGYARGSVGEDAIYAAAEGALAWLHARSSGPVVLMGRSLGTGVAVEMAARGHGDRVVLVTPYTSIPDVGAAMIPWFPVRWLARDRFDSLDKASRVRVPVVVVHGTRDEVIPYAQGQRLAAALPDARLITVRGAHHNDALEQGDGTLDAVLRFARGVNAGR